MQEIRSGSSSSSRILNSSYQQPLPKVSKQHAPLKPIIKSEPTRLTTMNKEDGSHSNERQHAAGNAPFHDSQLVKLNEQHTKACKKGDEAC